MAKQKYIIIPILALIIAQVLWGINTPVIKLGLRTVPLPVYHSITILGASLLILPFALKSWKRLHTKDYALLIIGSVIAISFGNVVLLMALRRVPSVNAPLIGLLQPLLLCILSVRFLKEKLSMKTLLGIFVAFTGAAIVIGKPWDWTGSGQDIIIGNLLLVLSVLCSVIGILVCKPALKQGGSYQITFIHLLAGILPVVFFAVPHLPALTTAEIGRSGFQAMGFNAIAVALANCLFMYGLKHKKLQETSIFSYIHPVVTAIAAWAILAELPSQKLMMGGLLIFLGIYLSEAHLPKHHSTRFHFRKIH